MDGWATLNSLKHQCESLKPGTEYVMKMTQQQLDEQFKKVITNEGCNVKIEKKNWKTVVVVTKKKWESDENLLAGLGDMWAWPVEEPDWLKQKERQVKQKEKQVKQKERQVSQEEKENYLAYQSLNFNKLLALTLKNYKTLSKNEVLWRLEELNKIITHYRVIWNERERNNILEWLWALKMLYKNNRQILKLLNDIEKKVKISELEKGI